MYAKKCPHVISVPKIDYLGFTEMKIETNTQQQKCVNWKRLFLKIIGRFDKILLHFCIYF